MVALSIVALTPIVHMIVVVLMRGGRTIVEAGVKFFTENPPPPGDLRYGIATSLVGSLELALISALISIPLAFATGILVHEFPKSVIGKLVTVFSKSLLEFPTIVIGMFVFTVVVRPMGSPSILAGAVSLALVMLPYLVSYVENALSTVPPTYREAGYSMGMNRLQVLRVVIFPIASRAIITGILLALAKALGETASLLFTLGRARMALNLDPLGPGDSITLLIYDYAIAPYENMRDVGWGAALVLISIYLLVHVSVRRAVREVRV